jgi:hypothetical protein
MGIHDPTVELRQAGLGFVLLGRNDGQGGPEDRYDEQAFPEIAHGPILAPSRKKPKARSSLLDLLPHGRSRKELGLGYLIDGKKQHSISAMVGGILMMLASYFSISALVMSMICMEIVAVVYFQIKGGN